MTDVKASPKWRRVNVVGTSGSGKSGLSRRLAEVLHCPHVEMDQLFWKPNWTMSDDEEFLAKLRNATAGPSWVLDGNYQRTQPIKWANVDAVVWLDLSFWRTLGQVVGRAISRATTRRELWAGTGNRESFRRSFMSRRSIIWWMMMTHAKNRRQYEETLGRPEFARIEFVRVRSHREAERLIARLRTP